LIIYFSKNEQLKQNLKQACSDVVEFVKRILCLWNILDGSGSQKGKFSNLKTSIFQTKQLLNLILSVAIISLITHFKPHSHTSKCNFVKKQKFQIFLGIWWIWNYRGFLQKCLCSSVLIMTQGAFTHLCSMVRQSFLSSFYRCHIILHNDT
jgi:hypothetical protein